MCRRRRKKCVVFVTRKRRNFFRSGTKAKINQSVKVGPVSGDYPFIDVDLDNFGHANALSKSDKNAITND